MPTIERQLAKASAGLLFPSESDYPFEVVDWDDRRNFSLPALLAARNYPPDTPVTELTLDDLFRNLASPQPWHDEGQAANVARFAALRHTLDAHLHDIRVYRVGTIKIDVYILGRTSANHIAGLRTTVIET